MDTRRAKVLMKERETDRLKDVVCSHCGKDHPVENTAGLTSVCCDAPLITYYEYLLGQYPDLDDVFDETIGTPEQQNKTKRLILFVGAIAFSIPCLVVLVTGWGILSGIGK